MEEHHKHNKAMKGSFCQQNDSWDVSTSPGIEENYVWLFPINLLEVIDDFNSYIWRRLQCLKDTQYFCCEIQC